MSPLRPFAPLLTLLLVLLSLHPLSAEVRQDLAYGEAGGEVLLLDAGIPDTPGPHPIVILVHGGGWMSGDKRQDMNLWFEPLRSAGFTWVSINYRLAPKHRWPACIDDVRTAIRWVKAHAAELRGDASRVAILGHSAGGHLATFAAVTGRDDAAVQAAVGLAAVTDFEQELVRRQGVSPALQALFGHGQSVDAGILAVLRENCTLRKVGTNGKGGTPPFLLLHGDEDKTVPLAQSLNLQSRVRSVEGRCDLWVLPGAGHRLRDWERFDPGYQGRAIGWLRDVLAKTAPLRDPKDESFDSPAQDPEPAPCTEALPMPAEAPHAGFEGLWYRQPAQSWVEALPVGNGRLGAMVYGGLECERLQLNEDSLWTGKPHEYQNEGAVKVLPELRALLFQYGRYLLIGSSRDRAAGQPAGPLERLASSPPGTASTPRTSTPR
jgi:acetyl esterase/lipase